MAAFLFDLLHLDGADSFGRHHFFLVALSAVAERE